MPTITEEIIEDLKELPLEMQSEALDFIKFLKQKLTNNKTQLTVSNGTMIVELLEQAAQQNLSNHISDTTDKFYTIKQSLQGRHSLAKNLGTRQLNNHNPCLDIMKLMIT